MKLKALVFIAIFLISLIAVNAQYIQPLDCDKLFNESTFETRTEYEELAAICFYGSGFEGESVSVKLEGDTNYQVDAPVSNGVVSSIVNGLKTFFNGVTKGIYSLVVSDNEQNFEYPEDIIVTGEEEPPIEPPQEVPEFTTIAAGLALAGAGYYINRKRK